MSVAVTDGDLVADPSNNIFSKLLLSDEVKGYVHNPAYYFSNYADSVKKHLDLVMLTHGWRKYNWQDIVANKTPQLTYTKDSDYLQVKGSIYTNDVYAKQYDKITLVLQSKDSSKQYLVAPIAQDGTFRQRGVIFFDTVKVFYLFPAAKNKEFVTTMSVKMDNGLQPVNFKKSLTTVATPSFVWNTTPADSILIKRTKMIAAENERLQKIYEGSKLKEVTVYAKTKSATEILDDKYTSGVFTTSNAYSFDIPNDERAQGALDILHYLQGQIPGLSMSLTFLGANGAEDANSSNAPGLNWRDGTPDIF